MFVDSINSFFSSTEGPITPSERIQELDELPGPDIVDVFANEIGGRVTKRPRTDSPHGMAKFVKSVGEHVARGRTGSGVSTVSDQHQEADTIVVGGVLSS